ncbi:hypothetical protein V6N12_062039 [Hibiscus sabdariffa]|uniref:Very-long-chain 3-oxoacyl-CoA synthase n=1 Tax=Hibiscus sabdariffa TaxID=183260 RepID=A0ABR2E002_9ROSI
MIATMNSTHTVVFVSENADPDVINVVVIEGLSLSRRPEPPDRSVFIATLQPIATSVKTLEQTLAKRRQSRQFFRNLDTILGISFWECLLLSNSRESFFSLNLVEWVLSNVKESSCMHGTTKSWGLFFASFIWHLWKRWNDFLFADAYSPLHAVFHHNLVWGSYYADGSNHRSSLSECHMMPVSWVPPPTDWLCLNTDAVVSTATTLGTVDGLIRNSSDAWISGFCKNIGHTTPLQAELWGFILDSKLHGT